jgi:primosomal protein N' (replication factor Y)
MIARVTLELALRREFDYLIPPDLAGQIDVGSRVKIPFGHRQVMGVVTELVENSPHTNLREITKVIGKQTLVTPKILKLARWIGEYYCCPPEIALKSVLPEAVRKEKEGWREKLFVRVLPQNGDLPKLTKRQQEIWKILEERKEIALQELLALAETDAGTVRRLEDKGLIQIAAQISERDPYAKENILPTQPLPLNTEQKVAFEKIQEAMGSTRVPRVRIEREIAPSKRPVGISEFTFRHRRLPHIEIPGRAYHVTWRTHRDLVLSSEARQKTLDACHFWHGKKIHCHMACVMPDHVHLLIRPLPISQQKDSVYSLSEILQSIKSFSAHQVNVIMGRTGFVWNDESFDRLIRSENDLHEKWNYIWNNPRKIGLVGPMEEYPFIWFPQEEVEKVNSHPPEAGATRTFLLHGVTGSGKTEVYLQAIAHALEQGKGAIVLVPEISLTPQTVERFKARFSSGPNKTLVAVLHSHLSAGERHDEWHKIRQGRARIVIGARSAVFAPVDPLGLIIVDEEHEHSYKQEESPRYHARDVAVVRGQMENAVVVLGSATPSMESFYNVTKGKYELLELPQRADDKKMPVVRVIDMRQVARKERPGGQPQGSIFSPQLKEAITQRLERKEQTILFLNRRGFATSLQCPLCGYVAECPNCSVSLTYHRAAQKLACHICGHAQKAPSICPNEKCRNPQIRYSGLGTEKVESILTKLFPQATIRRMDSDTLKRKEDYRNILGDFKRGKIDILVGTQMIAKGLHFPNVTLVGIIYADLSLHVPDFRAGERTFQLLTQVAGRAGRGDVEGEVYVQAFTPFHPAIQFARRHDFAGFYEQEIEFREQLKYPPLSRVALLTIKGRNEEKVKLSAEHLRKQLEKLTSENEEVEKRESETSELFAEEKVDSHSPTFSPAHFPDLVIAGPAPAPLARAETNYRYQIMLRTKQMTKLSQILSKVIQTLKLPDEVSVVVDIDPVNLT